MVQQLREKAVTVVQSCRLLGISASGYYEAKRRMERPKTCALTPVLKAAFAQSGSTYGSRRLMMELREHGHLVGRSRVRRLMHSANLRSVWKRKFIHTTDSRHDLPVAQNVLNRQFDPAAANIAWASDITYIRTASGWLYLAVVIELYSRKIIGWAMSATMPAALVCRALHMAIQQRAPAPGLIIHSDRGSQYASAEHQSLIQRNGLICSMSRVGNCWDNAVAERFFLTLKMERVWQRQYANRGEAERDITHYIVDFYNDRRMSSKLDHRSPNVFERQTAA
jgi:putative transposase